MHRAASFVAVGVFTLLCLFLISQPIQAEDSTFTITSYKPTHFSQWRWWMTGGVDAQSYGSSDHESNEVRESTRSQRDFEGWFTSHLFHTYYQPDRFGYFLVEAKPRASNSSDRYSRNTSGLPSDYYWDSTYTKSWNYSTDLTLAGEHSEYLSRDVYLGLDGFVTGYWSETPPFVTTELDSITMIWPTAGERLIESLRTERSSDDRRFELNLRPKVGMGRIYEGGYASTAYNMVKTLRDAGLLGRELDYSEYNALADTIYWNRRTVPIDSRDHRISALTAIGAYLHNIGVVQADPVRAALLLEDVWDYFPDGGTSHVTEVFSPLRPSITTDLGRPFGWRAEIGTSLSWAQATGAGSNHTYFARDGFYYSFDSLGNRDSTSAQEQTDRTTTSSQTQRTNKTSIFGALQCYRPLSYRWQFGFSGQVEAFLHYTTTGESNEVTAGPDAPLDWHRTSQLTYHDFNTFNSSMNLTYYFDSRNQITMDVASKVTYYSRSDTTRTWADDVVDVYGPHLALTQYDVSARVNYKWRVSVPTTLNIALIASWRRQNFSHSRWNEDHSLQLHAAIRHYLW